MGECKHCNTELSKEKSNNIFCNSSCAASFNNKGIRRNYSLGTREKKDCLNCGRETVNPKFCSTDCSSLYRIDTRRQKININNRIYSHRDKRFLIEDRGHKCEICETEDWLGSPVLLILDHIDGNSDNNVLDNIRLLCSNCDATLPTYKSRNKGNGRDSKRRSYRQNRYKSGSCN